MCGLCTHVRFSKKLVLPPSMCCLVFDLAARQQTLCVSMSVEGLCGCGVLTSAQSWLGAVTQILCSGSGVLFSCDAMFSWQAVIACGQRGGWRGQLDSHQSRHTAYNSPSPLAAATGTHVTKSAPARNNIAQLHASVEASNNRQPRLSNTTPRQCLACAIMIMKCHCPSCCFYITKKGEGSDGTVPATPQNKGITCLRKDASIQPGLNRGQKGM